MKEDRKELCRKAIEEWIAYWMEVNLLSRQEVLEIFRKELIK